MRVALAQIRSSTNPQENLQTVIRVAESAADEGAELIVFPEATMASFSADLPEVAEPVNGPWGEAVRTAATRLGITIVAGMFTPGPGKRIKNTLLIADSTGAVSSYDKIHLYDAFGYRESDTVAAGGAAVAVELQNAVVGMSTCYDVRFPEHFVSLAQAGANVIIVAASWGTGAGKRAQWELLTRARALDSVSWVLAVDQAAFLDADEDRVDGPLGLGYSAVIRPDGTVEARLGERPDILIVDLDVNEPARLRRTIPVLSEPSRQAVGRA